MDEVAHSPPAGGDDRLWSVDECQGLFVDALVVDHSNDLVFASFWGRDTACQEFLARLSVPVSHGGLEVFTVSSCQVRVGDTDRLSKITGRAPKGCLFGDLVQMILYEPICQTPDKAGRRAVLLYEGVDVPVDRLWALVQETCPLPLLPSWQAALMEAFAARGWIISLPSVGRANARLVDLGERRPLEALIRDMVVSGRLTLPEA